jgi:hypothetical protein
MDIIEPENVFAERVFKTHDEYGNSGEVRLIVGKPVMIDTYRWRCLFQVKGIGHEKIRNVDGMDALDALLSSLRLADAFLEFISKQEQKKLTWLDGDDLGLSARKI